MYRLAERFETRFLLSLQSRRIVDWDTEPKVTAIANRAVYPNFTIVAGDDLWADIKAKPQARKLVAKSIHTVITIEQMR